MLSLLFLLSVTPLEKVVYATGYIPNIQFAPFYVAMARGYYEEEGIVVEMDYTMGPDVLKLVALGKVQIASADPDAFLHAAARDLPLVHVASLYQSYPIALIAREPIFDKERLRGKRIGISATYGSSYLGLKNMLKAMDLDLADVHVLPIGFTQVVALEQGRVDAVVGYINNEPLRLRNQGVEVYTHTMGDQNLIPGVGLMTSRESLRKNKKRIHGFLRATFRGMHDVIRDPETCYALVVDRFLPELKGAERYQAELRTLRATIPLWQSASVAKGGYGQCSPRLWEHLANQMSEDQNNPVFGQWRDWIDLEFLWKPRADR